MLFILIYGMGVYLEGFTGSTPSKNRNRNFKLEISTAPTKAKSREPAYS